MVIYYGYDFNGIKIKKSDESDLMFVENKIIVPKVCAVNSLNDYEMSSYCKKKIK